LSDATREIIKRDGIVKILEDGDVYFILENRNNEIMTVPSYRMFYKGNIDYLYLHHQDPEFPAYTKEFRPDLNKGRNLKEMIYNTHTGFSIEPKQPTIISSKDNNYEGDTRFIYKHFRECWCGNESEEVFEWLLDWMAQLMQQPGNKVGKAIVLRSQKERAGKGIIFKLLFKPIFGWMASETQKAAFLNGDFDGELEDKMLYWIDEAEVVKKEQVNSLKNFVTEQYITIQRKFKQPEDVLNYTRFILATNNDKAIRLNE